MQRTGSPLMAAIIGSAAAGPVFVASLAFAAFLQQIPQPVVVTADGLATLVPITLLAFFIGFFLGLVPNLAGAALMTLAGDKLVEAQSPVAWVLAGAAAGAGLTLLFGISPEEPTLGVPVVLTSAVCAGLCRAQLRWHPD